MQNPPPNPQQNPPSYQPPYSQPLPPTTPPSLANTRPVPPTQPPYPPYSQPLPPVAPPYPPYPPYPPQPYPMYMPQPQDNTTALVLEAVCAVFGLYGIGWLFRGRVAMGIGLLALGFAWVGFAFFVALFTAGFALLCLGPLHLLLIVGDVLMLNSSLRQP